MECGIDFPQKCSILMCNIYADLFIGFVVVIAVVMCWLSVRCVNVFCVISVSLVLGHTVTESNPDGQPA